MLVSVYDLCATGHQVVFDLGEGGSYAIHKETRRKDTVRACRPHLGHCDEDRSVQAGGESNGIDIGTL
eukprot:1085236-Prorocentrum_lima.AAC.1